MDKNLIIINGRFRVDRGGEPISFEDPVLSARFEGRSHHCNFIVGEQDEDGFSTKYTVTFDGGVEYSDLDRVNFRLKVLIPEDNTYYILNAAGVDLVPLDFMKGIIYQDLVFNVDLEDFLVDDKGCVLPLSPDFEPCARYQPLDEEICVEEIFEIAQPENPSPSISFNYNSVGGGITINIEPKDTTLDCENLEEVFCIANPECRYEDSVCYGKIYNIDNINMDLDYVILNENQEVTEGVELRESRVIVDYNVAMGVCEDLICPNNDMWNIYTGGTDYTCINAETATYEGVTDPDQFGCGETPYATQPGCNGLTANESCCACGGGTTGGGTTDAEGAPLTIQLNHKDVIKKHSCLRNIQMQYIDPLSGMIKDYSVDTTEEMCFTLSTGEKIAEDGEGEWWLENNRELSFIMEFHPGINHLGFPVMKENPSLNDVFFPGDGETLIPTDCHLWDCASEEYCAGFDGNEDGCNDIEGCTYDGGDCVLELLTLPNTDFQYIKGQEIWIAPSTVPSNSTSGFIGFGASATWNNNVGWVGTPNLVDGLLIKTVGLSNGGYEKPLPDTNDIYRFKLTGKMDTRNYSTVDLGLEDSESANPQWPQPNHYPKNEQKMGFVKAYGSQGRVSRVGIRVPCKDYLYRPLNTLESFFQSGPPEDIHPADWRLGLDSIHFEGGIINAVDYSGDGISDGWLGTLIELFANNSYWTVYSLDSDRDVFFDSSYDNCFVCSGGDTGHDFDSDLDIFAKENYDTLDLIDPESDDQFDDVTYCCHYPYEVTTYYEQLNDDDYGRTWLSTQQICTSYGDGPIEYDDGDGVKNYYKKGSECLEDEFEDSAGNCIGSNESGAIVDRLGTVCLEGSLDLCGICYGDNSACIEELNSCPEFTLPDVPTVNISIIKINDSEEPDFTVNPLNPLETHELIVGFENNTPITGFSFDITSIRTIFSDGQPVVSLVDDFPNMYLSTNTYLGSSGEYVTNISGISTASEPLGTPDPRHQIKIRFNEFTYSNILEINNAFVKFENIDIPVTIPETGGFNSYDIPSTNIYGCLDETALNFNPIAANDCDVLGEINETSYNCCQYYFNTWPFDLYTSDLDTTFTDPFNINGVDYVLFEYQVGYEYEESDISNTEFFENLVSSYLGGTAFTVGANETEYALYEHQEGYEYEAPDQDWLDWLSGFTGSSAYGGFDNLDDWLMTSNEGEPIEDLPELLDGTLAEFGGVQIEYSDIYIRGIESTEPEEVIISYPFQSEFQEADFRDVIIASFYNEDGTSLQDIPNGSTITLSISNDSFEGKSIVLIKTPTSERLTVVLDETGEFFENGNVPAGAGLYLRIDGNGIIRWTLPS